MGKEGEVGRGMKVERLKKARKTGGGGGGIVEGSFKVSCIGTQSYPRLFGPDRFRSDLKMTNFVVNSIHFS